MDVLFIGNSFTHFNEMPSMVNSMAEISGASVHAEKLTYGGYYLKWFTDPDNSHGNEAVPLLQSRRFDYVVLQEQSKAPATDPELFAEGVAALMPHIRECGAKPVFYKTWAYARESEKLLTSGMGYEEMLEKLTASYNAQAEKYGAFSVPVGEMFYRVMEDHPGWTLLKDDAKHPGIAGSYLAACMFYKFFTGQNPPDSWLPEKLDSEHARILRSYL